MPRKIINKFLSAMLGLAGLSVAGLNDVRADYNSCMEVCVETFMAAYDKSAHARPPTGITVAESDDEMACLKNCGPAPSGSSDVTLEQRNTYKCFSACQNETAVNFISCVRPCIKMMSPVASKST